MHHLEEKLIEYQSMPTKCLCFLCNFILTRTLSVLALQFGIGHLLRELNWMAGQFVLFAWLILKIHRWVFGFTIKSANSSLKKIHTLPPQKHLRLQNDP